MTWLEQTQYELDALRGGAIRRLDALSASAPTGSAVFDAWNEIEGALKLHGSTNPLETAARTFPDHHDPRNRAVARLVESLLAAIAKELAAGRNDARDPLFRVGDFGHLMMVSGGGCYPAVHAVRFDDFKQWPEVIPGLPAGHPLRAVEPVELPDRVRVVIVRMSLDVDPPFFVRRSDVQRFTDAYRERLAVLERERQRMKAGIERDRISAAKRLEEEAHRIRSGVVVW